MAQGVDKKVDGTQRTKGTDTIFPIPASKDPFGRKNHTYEKCVSIVQTKQNPTKRDSQLWTISLPTMAAK